MKILVLDGNSIFNRAFYGIKLLTTKSGLYTNAIFGFMNILLKLQEAEKPTEIAIAFDLPAPTFRHKMYADYKGKRKGMPEELAQQVPILKELLGYLGYCTVSLEGFEADDILGTLAKAAKENQNQCLLATGDRDSLQLVSDNVCVLLTTTQFGKGETAVMDKAAIKAKYGVSPAQLIEVKALMGDASDNIPGVPGVGEKTAFALIQQFGSLDEVYKNIDDESIKPGIRQKLKDGFDSAQISHSLAVINCNVPIETEKGTYTRKKMDEEKAAALLTSLEMHSILNRLGLKALAEKEPQFLPKTTKKANVQPLKAGLCGTVYMVQTQDAWLAILQDSCTVYHAKHDDEAILQLLYDEKVQKHVFDAKPLHKLALAQNGQTKRAQGIVFDGKIAAYLLNPGAANYQVQALGAEYGVVPAFVCQEYPEAGVLQPLLEALFANCNKNGMAALLKDIEQPLAEVLASMELWGMAMDAAGVKAFGQELKKELEKQLLSIYQAVGYQFNVNSPKQLAKALFEDMGLPTRKKTKSGYSTDAETLESLRKYSPVVDTILLYRSYQKLNSTYVEGLLAEVCEDGRIHSTFNQTEARTGRISSNEPNMQNIPVRTALGSRLRKYFVAPKGTVLADADYSQIELRILAHISGDAAMQKAFLDGEDIHKATAALVNGLPLSMVTPQLRSSAKAVNFGIVYGIGAFSLSKDIGVSVKEADDFINSYLNSFPGVKNYMESTVQFGLTHGYVQTMFARRRPLPELASSNHNVKAMGQRIALNTPIQGTAADIIKLAMIKVWRRLRAENLTARLILQVHDELIVETPEDEVIAVSKILEQEMQNAAKLAVPLSADVHTGANWLLAKG